MVGLHVPGCRHLAMGLSYPVSHPRGGARRCGDPRLILGSLLFV
jgi:hypothetical protein